MVNYETTWYKSHGEIWKLIKERKAAGEIRKMVAMDGHQGPKEIHVQPEFFSWLSDPVKNGGGLPSNGRSATSRPSPDCVVEPYLRCNSIISMRSSVCRH